MWLFESKKRYGTRILNYAITSNHIHLLAQDGNAREALPKTIQLVAGRTAQEYNQRKKRKGAFWEDRYHATAVQDGTHLAQCMVYIDLNMVRAGVVEHPSQWPFCGYNEIQDPPQRYAVIDRPRLVSLLGVDSTENFSYTYRGWVEEALGRKAQVRETKWSESIAVGTKSFVDRIKDKLGARAIGRAVVAGPDGYELREGEGSYPHGFGGKMGTLSSENAYFWDESAKNSAP
jgi:putative transposase